MAASTLLPATTAAVTSLAVPASADPATIVSRTVLQTPDARVTLFEFAAGQELTTHTNRRRALIQVLRGTGEFFFNEEWHRLGTGSLLHLPPNHPHAVRADESFAMLLTLCADPGAPASEQTRAAR